MSVITHKEVCTLTLAYRAQIDNCTLLHTTATANLGDLGSSGYHPSKANLKPTGISDYGKLKKSRETIWKLSPTKWRMYLSVLLLQRFNTAFFPSAAVSHDNFIYDSDISGMIYRDCPAIHTDGLKLEVKLDWILLTQASTAVIPQEKQNIMWFLEANCWNVSHKKLCIAPQ